MGNPNKINQRPKKTRLIEDTYNWKIAHIYLSDIVNVQDLNLRIVLHLWLIQQGDSVFNRSIIKKCIEGNSPFLSQIARIYTQSQNADKQLYGITIVEFRYEICNYLSLTYNHVIVTRKKKQKKIVYE